MVSNVTDKNTKIDFLLWMAALALVVVVSFTLSWSDILVGVPRAISMVLSGVFAGLLALKTSQGRKFILLWRESVMELRKVVWPSNKETLQSLVAVLSMVLVMCIILWTVDAILIRMVAILTGYNGEV